MASLVSQLLSLRVQNPPKQPEIYNRAYRVLVTKSYKRTRPRRVFRTKTEINPVYDIQYSPVQYSDHRVLAVGDERGYLSVLRVRLEDGKRVRGKKESERGEFGGLDHHQGHLECGGGMAMSIPTVNPSSRTEEEPPPITTVQPVLYTIAWNRTGNKILAGYGDGSLRMWDIGKEYPLCELCVSSYTKSVKRVAWGDNDATLISCSRTNEIMVHDTRMRNNLANKIDCTQQKSKLTDIAVLYPYILSCSSNQSSVSLWDLRKTYKLYKKIHPVQTYELGSPGYSNIGFDAVSNDNMIYALGCDSKVRSFNWRNEKIGSSYRVPGGVDFFTKIDVDRVSNVLVSGGTGKGAYLYDLSTGGDGVGEHELVEPFWELNGERKWDAVEGWDESMPLVDNKENEGGIRSCCAVAFGNRRGFNDGFVQIATGGDDSCVTLWD